MERKASMAIAIESDRVASGARRHASQRLSALLLAVAALLAARGAPAAPAGGPPWVVAPVSAPNVMYGTIDSAAVGGQVSFHAWLPDAYATEPGRRFPVLYWLHGSGSVSTGIAPVSAAFDAAVDAGLIPPLIVVFPNGLPYGMWCDAASGLQPVESMLIDDLLPAIDARLRTIPEARARLLEGFSMGGYGAARLGLRHAARFAGVSMLGAGPLQLDFLAEGENFQPIELRRQILATVYGNSPAIFEQQSPWRLAQVHGDSLPQGFPVRQLIGTLDFTLEPNRDFHQHLLDLGIAHEYLELPGVGHSVPAIIGALGPAFWRFHREALRSVDVLLADGFEPPAAD
jgi:enterochelin esterase-like enzyme